MARNELKRLKTLQWALGVSLGVNLLVIGLVAGVAFRSGGPHGDMGRSMRDYGTPYIIALPEERRRAMFRDIRGKRPDKSVNRAARRAMFSQALTALRADPFDADRARAALTAQREAMFQVQQTVQDAWLEEIGQMDKAARLAYADRLEDLLKRGSRRKRATSQAHARD